MAGKIIWWAVTFGCAALFFIIGIYSKKRATPMHFWSGTQVEASLLTDVKGYNRENGVMWQLYALWYLAAGLAAFWNMIAGLILLVLSCTVGIVLLIRSYRRIFQKYSVPA